MTMTDYARLRQLEMMTEALAEAISLAQTYNDMLRHAAQKAEAPSLLPILDTISLALQQQQARAHYINDATQRLIHEAEQKGVTSNVTRDTLTPRQS